MKNSIFYFLCSSLIPKLCADISAGTSCNIHFWLVTVFAVRALPYKLTVFIVNYLYFAFIATFLTIIALCIKLRIYNIIVYKLYNAYYGFNIVLHIRYFNIAYCTAGWKCLKLRLKGKLCTCIYLLWYMNMIAVCYIILVSNARYYTETFL